MNENAREKLYELYSKIKGKNTPLKEETKETTPKKKKTPKKQEEVPPALETVMDTYYSKPKKAKKTKAEKQYDKLVASNNTLENTVPPVTPMKRKASPSKNTPTPQKRKVVFNLKNNRTQHFNKKESVADMEVPQVEKRTTPTKGLLKSKPAKKRKAHS